MVAPAPAARLRPLEKLGYGLGDTASNFFFQTFNLFLLYYYTDIFGLGAAAVGTMFLFTRVLDAVTDPAMGLIADRTSTRWGKYRPYLLWMALPYGLLGYLVFANPDLTPSGKLVYAYVTYSAMMLAYTAINIPYGALMGVMSPSTVDRTSLSAYRFVCAFAGAVLISSLVTPLKNALGGTSEADGFRWTMAIFAVASIALFLFCFATTKERVVVRDEVKPNLRNDLKLLLRNPAWVAMGFAALFNLTNVAVRGAVTVYYLKYYVQVGTERVFLFMDHIALFMTTGALAMIVGVALTPLINRRWDKRRLMIVLSTLNALAMASFFFLRPDQVVAMYVINIVGTLFAGPTPALVWAMYADAADYGEWKFRRRTTALIFSAAQFAQKMGLAVGVALAGWILGLAGFVANLAQTEQTLTVIRILFSFAPAGFALLNVAALVWYPLDDKTVLRIEQELAERRRVADTGARESTLKV
jgi:glycoside/pentoside/hexuronide:cation symporter, GPH family